MNIFNYYRHPGPEDTPGSQPNFVMQNAAQNQGTVNQQPNFVMQNAGQNQPTNQLVPSLQLNTQQGTTNAQTTPPSALLDGVDTMFSMDFLGTDVDLKSVLGLDKGKTGYTNAQGGMSSIIINSDRIIVNTKTDHLFLCGKTGVTITSPDTVHIDCTNDLHLFSETGEIYLGLPNKGQSPDKASLKVPTQKWEPTTNQDFEPVVLGIKLTNFLEDMLVIMRELIVRGNLGDSRVSPENMTNIEFLKNRLPELLSTTVYVDGYSHGAVPGKPDLGQIAGFFKTVNGTVDPLTLTNELTQVGYTQAEISNFLNSAEGQALTAVPVVDATVNAGAASQDGAVGANKATNTTNGTATTNNPAANNTKT